MGIPTVTVTGTRPQGSSGAMWANYGEAEAIGIGSPGMDSLYTDALLQAAFASQRGPTRADNPKTNKPGKPRFTMGSGISRQDPWFTKIPSIPPLLQPKPLDLGQVLTSPTRGPKVQVASSVRKPEPTGLKIWTEKFEPRVLTGKALTDYIRRPQVQVRQPQQPQVRTGPVTTVAGLNTNQRGNTMALDLGSLLNTALVGYGDYQTAKLQQNVFNPFSSLADIVSPDTSVPYLVGAPCKRRKRRRRLATPSDIKDLAALSSVTTPSEKKTWIATHPS